jgi:hypothetical protein
MSSTGVTLGYGLTVEIGRGEVPTWTEIVGVGDVDFPTGEADEVDVTHMKSPSRTKEYIAGLDDNGVVTIPHHWVQGSDTDTLLTELKESREIIQIRFTTPEVGATPETYAGFLKSYKRSAPIEDKMMADAEFRINGLVVA